MSKGTDFNQNNQIIIQTESQHIPIHKIAERSVAVYRICKTTNFTLKSNGFRLPHRQQLCIYWLSLLPPTSTWDTSPMEWNCLQTVWHHLSSWCKWTQRRSASNQQLPGFKFTWFKNVLVKHDWDKLFPFSFGSKLLAAPLLQGWQCTCYNKRCG